jgi:hypothetical protein
MSCRGSESVPLGWPTWAQTGCWAETDARQEGDQSLRSASLPSVSGHPASHHGHPDQNSDQAWAVTRETRSLECGAPAVQAEAPPYGRLCLDFCV